MTSWTRKRLNATHGQQVPIAGSEAQTKRLRRHGIVFCTVVVVGASAVFAVMMLTATPASAAPAAQPLTISGDMPGMSQDVGHPTPTPTMSGDMPGMDHGPADKPASSPSPTMSGDMPGMDHGDGHGSSPSPTSSADSPWKTHDDSGGHEHGSSPSPTASEEAHGTEHGATDKPGADTGHGDVAEVATDRPLAPVLGTFGGASSAVMLSAAFLRRKDRARSLAKQAARAARKAQK